MTLYLIQLQSLCNLSWVHLTSSLRKLSSCQTSHNISLCESCSRDRSKLCQLVKEKVMAGDKERTSWVFHSCRRISDFLWGHFSTSKSTFLRLVGFWGSSLLQGNGARPEKVQKSTGGLLLPLATVGAQTALTPLQPPARGLEGELCSWEAGLFWLERLIDSQLSGWALCWSSLPFISYAACAGGEKLLTFCGNNQFCKCLQGRRILLLVDWCRDQTEEHEASASALYGSLLRWRAYSGDNRTLLNPSAYTEGFISLINKERGCSFLLLDIQGFRQAHWVFKETSGCRRTCMFTTTQEHDLSSCRAVRNELHCDWYYLSLRIFKTG